MAPSIAPEPETPAAWTPPWPLGFPGAMDSTGSVAAPLLGGFSFALIGLIVPEASGIRWPGVALSLLVVSGFSFIAAVQCGFWAREWSITPDDLTTWRGDRPEAQREAEMRLHLRGFAIWAARLRRSYRLGIVTLLFGISILLIPRGDISGTRWLAIAFAAFGCLLETAWICAQWVLAGSPVSVYNNAPDQPKPGTPALWIRSAAPLRRLARAFVPLVRTRA